MTAFRIDRHLSLGASRAAANHDPDLARLADIWWGDGRLAGVARRRAQRRFVVALALGSVAIASVASVAAKPSSAALGAVDPRTVTVALAAPRLAAAATRAQPFPPPADYAIEMALNLERGESLEELLVKAGAAAADARSAAMLIPSDKPLDGGPVLVFLGDRATDGSRRIVQITLRPSLARHMAVVRPDSGELKLLERTIAVDATPVRITGTVGGGLFWSLRAAGVTPELASDYLSAMAGRGTAAAGDRFELVANQRRAATGEIEPGALQYAGLDRSRGSDVRLIRWMVDGRSEWIDPEQSSVRASAPALPLGGRISSHFGLRTHPIFGRTSFHRGVDIRAAWGTPVHASGDGQVTTSGWSGGYGLRIRVAHRDGVDTSYSHLSRIVVPIGTSVLQGDLIGFVGSTGFSTGSHLHFELFRGGEAINPLGAKLDGTLSLSRSDRAALAARMSQLRSIPAA